MKGKGARGCEGEGGCEVGSQGLGLEAGEEEGGVSQEAGEVGRPPMGGSDGKKYGMDGCFNTLFYCFECFELLFVKFLGLRALFSRISSNCLALIKIHPKVS